MSAARAKPGRWSGRAIACLLALIGVAINLAVPPGFMLQTAADAPPGLVICTGHGALELSPVSPEKPAPGKSAGDMVCVFAAHMAGALTPPCCATLGQAVAFADIVRAEIPRDIVPGRGLAAPPPPSHAPPSLV